MEWRLETFCYLTIRKIRKLFKYRLKRDRPAGVQEDVFYRKDLKGKIERKESAINSHISGNIRKKLFFLFLL